MFALRRYALPRRLQVVLGLALMGLVLAPTAFAAAPLDTVNVTGSGGDYSSINITAQSGTSGQTPSGNVSAILFGTVISAGPVTCLSVTGPDRGGGTPTAPTTAILNFQEMTLLHQIITLKVVDNGGNGADTISGVATIPPRAPADCSPPSETFNLSTLTNGRAVVFDAPVLPTSKAQCKNGGWRNYPQFKNQGQCVAFVVKQARRTCLGERAKIGLVAFRHKYGLGVVAGEVVNAADGWPVSEAAVWPFAVVGA